MLKQHAQNVDTSANQLDTKGVVSSAAIFASTDLSAPNAASIHVLSLLQAFASLGCDSILVAPKPPSAKPLSMRFERDNAVIHFTPALWWRWLPNGFNFLTQIPTLFRLCLRRPPAIIYVRSGICSALITLLARLLARSHVVTEHNGWMADEAAALGYSKWKCALAAGSQLLDGYACHRARVVSKGIGQLLVERGVRCDKIQVIGNGTDLAHFTILSREHALSEFGLNANRVYAGFIGNLVPWQGVSLAIDALALIADEVPHLDLIIAGHGPQRDSLERLTVKLGVRARVHFLGEIDFALAPVAIGAMDVALAPFVAARNDRIGLSPLKIRDYAACGKTVLCARIAGLEELAKEPWCYMHQPDDAGDLAAKMACLVRSRASLPIRGARARQYAQHTFAWRDIAKAILTLPVNQS